jgi:Lrp/AsnC family transcriptional regulator for asnA, asnC and gidA|tara:strand:- start:377 stop:955 length:579 start_codon:yes stop_codon:yes gene_type:complete
VTGRPFKPFRGERARTGRFAKQHDKNDLLPSKENKDNSESPIFDELNRKILEYLQEDGRTPFSAIARQLGTSEGTVRNRVQQMRDAGALQIAAIIDPMAIKYKVDAIIGVNVASPNLPRVVAERLSVLEQTTYIFWVAGRFDLLVEVVCSSDPVFEQFIEEQLCQQTDVSQFEIMSGIKMYKNQFILRDAVP